MVAIKVVSAAKLRFLGYSPNFIDRKKNLV